MASTLATAGALVIAALAALIALRQYQQGAAMRLDQSRPYVLVTAQPSPVSRSFIDIVIQNVGVGPARDVSIDVSPPLMRAEESGHPIADARVFNEPIPMLPPGFSIRAFYDSAIDRHGKDLPARHEATISYHDGHGHHWTETSVIDVELQRGLLYTEEYSIHHVAKSLREIEKFLRKSRILNGDIDVTVEDRDARAQRLAQAHAERQAAHEELTRRVLPKKTESGSGEL